MKNPEEIFELLKKEYGEMILGLDKDTPVDPTISVAPMQIHKIGAFLRDNEDLKFDSLMVLSAVDDANGTKAKDEDGTDVISGGTLSVYYHLHSTTLKHKIVIKVSTSRENPVVESVYNVWRTSDWHEREAFDMFGIIFKNHPDLRRILMPYDWEAGFPLRKDYKNPEFYQGMKVPY